MKYNILALFCLTIIFVSCHDHKPRTIIDNRTYRFPSKYTLIPSKPILFGLDSLTNSNINNIQLFKTDSITYLTFLNKQFNSIYFYDFNTSKFKFTINIQTTGKDRVGPIVNSYYIKAFDSIYVVSRYVVSIINHKGQIRSQMNFLKDHSKGGTALPQIFSYAPLITKGDTLLINCVPDKIADKTSSFYGKLCMIKYNTRTGESSYEYEYPEAYRDGVYGANYMVTYHTYNPDTKKIVFSFPADNDVYVSSGENLIPYYAGGKALDSIKPMTTVRDDFEGYNKFYLQNPSYGPIFYDKFRKIYYRFALKPISAEDYQAKRWWKKKSIVILDESFKKVGEVDVSDYVSFKLCFINEDGLYMGTDVGDAKIGVTLFKLQENK